MCPDSSEDAPDFLRGLELLGVTARLKRLSDALSADIRELYDAQGLDLEPSWHLLILFLRDRVATQSEIAAALRLSLPAVTVLVRRMGEKGYLEVDVDAQDGRRRIVRLSRRARRRLSAFEVVWEAGRRAVGELLGPDAAFATQLDSLEDRLSQEGFLERAQAQLSGGSRGAQQNTRRR